MGKYTRDVFPTRSAARLAAFDAILACCPHTLTTPGQLAVLIDLTTDGYLASGALTSLAEYTAEMLADSKRTVSSGKAVAFLTGGGT